MPADMAMEKLKVKILIFQKTPVDIITEKVTALRIPGLQYLSVCDVYNLPGVVLIQQGCQLFIRQTIHRRNSGGVGGNMIIFLCFCQACESKCVNLAV